VFVANIFTKLFWIISHINYGLMHNNSEIWGLFHEATGVTSNKLTGEGGTSYK